MAFPNTIERVLSFCPTLFLKTPNSITLQKYFGMRLSLLSIIILFLFTNCSPNPNQENSILSLIPVNAAIVIKINDFEAIKDGLYSNEIMDELESSKAYSKISKKIHPISFLTGQNKGVLVFTALDSANFDFTYISKDSLSFKNWESSSNKTIESIDQGNSTFTKYQIEDEIFYSASLENHSILSSSLSLLQNLPDGNQDSNTNTSLNKFYAVSNSEKAINLWVDLEKVSPILNHLFSTNKKLPIFGKTVSFDFTLNDTELLLNGVIQIDTTQKSILNLFRNTNPSLNKIFSLVPSDADYATSYTLENFNKFITNKDSNNLTVSNVDSLLNTVEEIGLAVIENDSIAFLRTYGTAALLDFMDLEKIGATEFAEYEIWELKSDSGILEPIAALIGSKPYTYTCIVENNFLFAKNEELLKKVLSNYKIGAVYSNTDLFKNANAELPSSSTLLTLSNLQGTTKLLKANGASELSGTMPRSGLKDYLFGQQVIADNGFFHLNFLVKKITEEVEKNTITSSFDVKFNADLAIPPQFVTNHNNRRKEIIVQDQDNIVYLISASGKILWKKQLDATIQGKIHQVDIYKNGKLQLAFTTNNQFLILDRNGKEVAPFTMKFEGGNLNPLAVFDYDGKKEYRFLVTQGKKVFMYNNKGNIVKGFKYDNAEGFILNAPQHFRVDKKDYIVFKLEDGQLRILNRVGDTRIPVKNRFSFSTSGVKLYQNKFTFTSNEGILYQIDTKGNLTQNNLNLTKDHGMDATSRTLAIINDNILSIRDKKVELELGVYSSPVIFYINDKIFVTVTDIQNQKIYLFDSQAKAIPNFPVYGNSIIDMGDMENDQKLEIVTKDQENSIKVYSIN